MKSEIEKGQDPTVNKQWDDETPLEKRFEDFAAIADGLKIGMMGTLRNGVGVRADSNLSRAKFTNWNCLARGPLNGRSQA